MHGGRGLDDALNGPAAEILAGDFVLIVALVEAGNAPYAARGWGLTVLREQPLRMRLLLSREDGFAPGAERNRTRGGFVALTATDPRTMQSVQFKGRAEVMEPATDEDLAIVSRFCDSFFAAVKEVEGTERRLLERMVPTDFAACTIVVDEVFDQTPGPGAGAPLSAVAK
jgi:hypothetical protein